MHQQCRLYPPTRHREHVLLTRQLDNCGGVLYNPAFLLKRCCVYAAKSCTQYTNIPCSANHTSCVLYVLQSAAVLLHSVTNLLLLLLLTSSTSAEPACCRCATDHTLPCVLKHKSRVSLTSRQSQLLPHPLRMRSLHTSQSPPHHGGCSATPFCSLDPHIPASEIPPTVTCREVRNRCADFTIKFTPCSCACHPEAHPTRWWSLPAQCHPLPSAACWGLTCLSVQPVQRQTRQMHRQSTTAENRADVMWCVVMIHCKC
jgi:hypothetical protein